MAGCSRLGSQCPSSPLSDRIHTETNRDHAHAPGAATFSQEDVPRLLWCHPYGVAVIFDRWSSSSTRRGMGASWAPCSWSCGTWRPGPSSRNAAGRGSCWRSSGWRAGPTSSCTGKVRCFCSTCIIFCQVGWHMRACQLGQLHAILHARRCSLPSGRHHEVQA